MPKPPKTSSLPPLAQIMPLTGDAKNGELLSARCFACHQIKGNGVAFGPDLKRWISDQGKESFLRAVIDPSAEIAHGYNGAVVNMPDGKKIQGLVLNQKDPIIVQSMGGLTQIIPEKLGGKVGKFKQSLMLSADQLGLTAQDLADLAAYMETVK